MEHPDSPADTHLRVGIALDSLVVPAWVAKVVRDIRAADFVRIALIVVHNGGPAKSFAQRLMSRNGSGFLFGLYEWIDYRLFRSKLDAFAPVDLGAAHSDLEIAQVAPTATRRGDHYSETDVRRL